MALHGFAPISSSLYLTKRARLSDALVKDREINEQGVAANDVTDLSYSSNRMQTKSGVPPTSDDYELHRGLVELARRRLKFASFDTYSDDTRATACDGLEEGINFLSQQRCISEVSAQMDAGRYFPESQRKSAPLIGRINDIASIVNLDGSARGKSVLSKRVAAGADSIETLIGPLSANEVAHLLLLAQKLKETNQIDDTLERNIEMSSNMWKQTGKVPNVVATAVVASLYEGKAYQCATCGIRFSTYDARSRHSLSHEEVRRDLLWSTLDEWISTPHLPSSVRSGQKVMMTLKGISSALLNDSLSVSSNLKWLCEALFWRVGAEKTTKDVEMESDAPIDKTDEISGSSKQSQDDSMQSLWSWGTMKDCRGTPIANTDGRSVGTIGVESDVHILLETCHKVKFNVSRCKANVPFPVNFADLTRKCCVICHDVLEVEFSAAYNCYTYADTTCFKLDGSYIKRAFQDEQLSCKILLATNGLSDMEDPFLVLRKSAAFTLVKSALNAWSNEESVGRSGKEFVTTGGATVPPDRKTLWPDNQQLTGELAQKWSGPFAAASGTHGIPNSLMYAHSHCVRFFLNAHTRRAKTLTDGNPCARDIASISLL
ncbi:Inner membrane [Babesia ovata]|uniref:Inner membrane n=1 Tax=Babesia ovata TaxID=189622 RepID=A0A2H6KI26_9APIC|nr:Inner membrane [Babesia ovata]GBE62644.1 Inner membrane [Babesia ovata]